MSDTLISLLLPLLLAGAAAGLIAGLLGVGGGILLVPVLSVVLPTIGVPDSVSMHIAVASSLAVIIATAIASARAHAKRGSVDTDLVRRWAPFIAIGALAGALVARMLSGDVLRVMFAVLAFVLGVRFLLARERETSRLALAANPQRACAAGIGVLSAWLGIGGGSFSVPLINALGRPVQRAVGTSAWLGLFIAVPATAGYIVGGLGVAGRPDFSLGYLHLPSVIIIGAAGVLLAPVGAQLAHALPQRRLKQVFGVFLLMASARLIQHVLG